MRLALAIACAAVVLVAAVQAARRTHAVLQPDPGRIPDVLPAGDDPTGIWVFARAGCRACALHLEAMQRGASGLPAATRAAALQRVRLVGEAACPDAVRCMDDAARRAAGVQRTPTTWHVRADGTIGEIWYGPRSAATWRRALANAATSVGSP